MDSPALCPTELVLHRFGSSIPFVMIGSSSNGSYHRDHAKRTHFHGEVGETWGSEARRPSWQKTWSRVDSWLSNPGFYFF